jgi:hypothetical protein
VLAAALGDELGVRSGDAAQLKLTERPPEVERRAMTAGEEVVQVAR